ncbi:hypothetical protein ACI4CU_27300, partial [Klebsiella pneumoniae]|uniref:hypothetical protein n=2 Tax=Klebsiella pneumoniae TaxID=573 RepID=UPI0038528E98
SNKTIKRILTPVKTKGNDYSVVLVVLFAILLTVGLNYAWVLLLNHVCLWLFGWAVTWQHMTIIFVGCCIWNSIFRRDERK